MKKLTLTLLFIACVALAQRSMTVDQVSQFIKSQIKLKGPDKTTADFLKTIKLSQKLEDRTVEELQGMGAGPKTVAALRKLEEETASLAAAPPPPVVAPVAVKPGPDSMQQAEIIAAMRDYALNYTKKLPNYLCVQITTRHMDPKDPKYRSAGDVIQEQLSFNDQKETYKVQLYNGQAVHNMSHEQLGGVRSSGEFGSMLHNIFSPDHDAKIDWDHWGKLRDHAMYVFSYRIEKDHGYGMYDDESKKQYTSAYTGLVYADVDTKEIQRITLKTVEIPSDFPVRDVALTLDYKPTQIAGQIFVLPFHYELDSIHNRGSSKNEALYKLYQMYGAESAISFEDSSVPEDQLKEQPVKPPVKKQP